MSLIAVFRYDCSGKSDNYLKNGGGDLRASFPFYDRSFVFDTLILFKLRKKMCGVIRTNPRYMRERIQIFLIYRAIHDETLSWVVQHINNVQYDVIPGRPVSYNALILEFNETLFHELPTCIIEFTDGKRCCIVVQKDGHAEVLFSLSNVRLKILYLSSKGYTKPEIAYIMNLSNEAIYSNIKEILKILDLYDWDVAVSKVSQSGILYSLE